MEQIVEDKVVLNEQDNTVTVYACGGAGLNIGKHLEEFSQKQNLGFAKINIVYIDTSLSDADNRINTNNLFTISNSKEEIDGSGQIRKENANEIIRQIGKLLLKHPPSEFNIVLSSGSGGSGSVLAPTILSEMLKRDARAIAILVGDKSTIKYAENTLATIQSYVGVSKVNERPTIVYFCENSQLTSEDAVDQDIIGTVAMLRLLFSGNNHGMDKKDLYNWQNYHRVTNYSPKIARLEIVKKDGVIESDRACATIATLASKRSEKLLDGVIPDFQVVGYVPEGMSERIVESLPIHFAIFDDGYSPIITNYQRFLSEHAERRNARKATEVSYEITSGTQLDNGLVL